MTTLGGHIVRSTGKSAKGSTAVRLGMEWDKLSVVLLDIDHGNCFCPDSPGGDSVEEEEDLELHGPPLLQIAQRQGDDLRDTIDESPVMGPSACFFLHACGVEPAEVLRHSPHRSLLGLASPGCDACARGTKAGDSLRNQHLSTLSSGDALHSFDVASDIRKALLYFILLVERALAKTGDLAGVSDHV